MKYQFMPMFWGDFFANTLHLSAQELGAYTALIGHVWEHDGKIAAEDVQRVARVSNYNWVKIKPRVSQFFDTLSVPNFWIHERVCSELTHAAELSNKRKAAAEHLHSKRTSQVGANGLQATLHYNIENLSNGKGREGAAEQVQPPKPPPKPVDYRDTGNDYRSPPAKKSDNVLTPLPDKPTRRPAAADSNDQQEVQHEQSTPRPADDAESHATPDFD